MNFKRILGTIFIVVGICLIYLSNYVADEVAYQSQKARNQTKAITRAPVPSNNAAVQYGSGVMGSAVESHVNDKIDEAARPYQMMALYQQAAGVIFIVVGGVLVIFGRSKKE